MFHPIFEVTEVDLHANEAFVEKNRAPVRSPEADLSWLVDEVDAPLDEVNTERFIRLVRDFSRESARIIAASMRIEVETGTDVAAIAVADPSALDELRSSRGDAFEQQRQAAVADGRLWRADTGADGAYLIHLFVDEDPPEHVSSFLRDAQVLEPFRVPSGRLVVAGEELVVTPQSVANHPHMGREVRVPAGTYKLTAFRVDEARGEWIEDEFAAAVSPGEKRAWDIGNSLPVICAAVTIAAFIASYFVFTGTTSLLFAALPVGVAVLAWVGQARFRRSSAYKAAERLYRQLERGLPSVVIVLRSLPAA